VETGVGMTEAVVALSSRSSSLITQLDFIPAATHLSRFL
jgi:hypothetical protein